MLRRHALAAIAGLAVITPIDARAADPLPTVTYKLLPAALSLEAAQAALVACKTQGYNVTVSVVDRLGLSQNSHRRRRCEPDRPDACAAQGLHLRAAAHHDRRIEPARVGAGRVQSAPV